MQKRKTNNLYERLEFFASKEDVERLNKRTDERVGYVALSSTGAYELSKKNINYFSYHDVPDIIDFSELAVEIYSKLSTKLRSLEHINPEYTGLLYCNKYIIFHDLIGVINHALMIISISNYLNTETIVIKRSSWWIFNEVQSHYLEEILKAYFISLNKVIIIEGEIGNKSIKKISLFKKIISRNIVLINTAFNYFRIKKIIKKKIIHEDGVILYFGGHNYDLLTFHKYLKWVNRRYRYISININNFLNNNSTQYISSLVANFKFNDISNECKVEISEMVNFRNDDNPIKFYQFNEFFNIDKFTFDLIKNLSTKSKSVRENTVKTVKHISENVAVRAVMFYDCVNIANIIASDYFNKKNIKTFIYQNGGVYGAQINQPLADMVQENVNIFIAYGDNIKPLNPSAKTKATFKSIGSLRLHNISLANTLNFKKGGAKRNILWVSEGTSHNTYSLWYQSEDVLRFKFQIESIKILLKYKYNNKINFIFRPIPNQCNDLATPDWISENYSKSLVDINSRFTDLVSWADIVISDVHANTTWDEVLTLNKPMILYLNPQTTKLSPDYSSELDLALKWCKDEPTFMKEMEKISIAPAEYIRRYNKNPRSYLNKYANSDNTILDSLINEVYR